MMVRNRMILLVSVETAGTTKLISTIINALRSVSIKTS